MTDKFFISDSEGNQVLVGYEDLDEEQLEKVLQPIGGFIFPGEAFIRLPLASAPFYIKDWLPKHGRLEIYGQDKSGKSTLAIQIARCISQGEPFLGMTTTLGKVLYIQCELGVETLQKKVIKTGQNYDDVYFGTTFSLKLDKKEGQEMLLRAVEAVKPQVLILDPFYKMLSEADENEASGIMPILNFLDAIIELHEDCGLSIVIFHHAGKDLSRGGRGSSVMSGWVDSYVELRRVSLATEPILRSRLTSKLLRHAAMPTEAIDIVLDDNLEFQVGEKPLRLKDRLFKFAQERGKFKMQEAIDAGVGSRKSLYDARNVLLKEEKLVDLGESIYQAKNK